MSSIDQGMREWVQSNPQYKFLFSGGTYGITKEVLLEVTKSYIVQILKFSRL